MLIVSSKSIQPFHSLENFYLLFIREKYLVPITFSADLMMFKEMKQICWILKMPFV